MNIVPDRPWWRSYHGIIVLAAMLVLMISNGLVLSGLGPFRKAYAAELGWSPSAVAYGDLLTFWLLGLLAPLMGPLIDRFGTRVLMQLGLLALAAGYYAYGDIDSLGDMYAIHVLFAAVLALCGLVPVVALVSRWFDRARGTAVGIALAGSSLASFVFPPLAEQWLIPAYGWRAALQLEAWAALFGFILVVLLVRSVPGELGLKSYGAGGPAPARAADLPGLSVREALRTPSFWILGLCAFLTFFALIGTLGQMPFFLASLQIETVSAGYACMLGFALVGKFLFGWLADRLAPKRVFLGNLGLMAVGAVALALAGKAQVYAALAVFGLGWGGLYTLLQLQTLQIFGLRSAGKLMGLMSAFDCVGGGLGGLVLAQIFATSGSYAPAFCLLAGMLTLALLAATAIRQEFR